MGYFFNKVNGKLTNVKAIKKAFDNLPDGQWFGDFENKKKRSGNQNQYYWGCCLPIVVEGLRDAGYNEVKSNEDAHEILKHLFLRKSFTNEKTGEVITVEGSTTKLTTTEFNAFIEEVAQWSSEYLGIVIPPPNTSTDLWSDYAEPAKSQRV